MSSKEIVQTLDKKYFASDRDKFLFWLEDGFITFDKFSEFYGDLEEDERLPLYQEFLNLPEIDWRAVKLKDSNLIDRDEVVKLLEDMKPRGESGDSLKGVSRKLAETHTLTMAITKIKGIK